MCTKKQDIEEIQYELKKYVPKKVLERIRRRSR